MGDVELDRPGKADWATVGPVEVGGYTNSAMLFIHPPPIDEDSDCVLLTRGELRRLGEACLVLADALDARNPEPVE